MVQDKVRVAVIQTASIMMDREATTGKAVSLIHEAAEKGANLVVFPEAFIPGYPRIFLRIYNPEIAKYFLTLVYGMTYSGIPDTYGVYSYNAK